MSKKLQGSLGRLKKKRPQAMALSGGEPVFYGPLAPDGDLPRLVRPKVEDVDLIGWAGSHRGEVEEQLAVSGGLLFRGFGLRSVEDFESFCAALSPELLPYGERSTPRSEVRGKVYTSTEYPADQEIPMHNELSYASQWPAKIWFFCVQPAADGGATPIADSRQVYREIDQEVRQRFIDRKVRYVRNFGEHLGLSWQEVYRTDDRAELEARCHAADIELEWGEGDRLKTIAVRSAVSEHPVTGEPVWFNQAHLHHVSGLPPEVRESLLEVVAEDELPFNTFYGDGGRIAAEELDEVRRAYRQATITFPWQKGDILMLDNVLISHGRDPYEGERKIVVAMG